jgi:hypothetical protein
MELSQMKMRLLETYKHLPEDEEFPLLYELERFAKVNWDLVEQDEAQSGERT